MGRVDPHVLAVGTDLLPRLDALTGLGGIELVVACGPGEIPRQVHGVALAAATPHTHDVDLWPALATPEGTLRPEMTHDKQHPTGPGYRAWVEILRPLVAALDGAAGDQPIEHRPGARTVSNLNS